MRVKYLLLAIAFAGFVALGVHNITASRQKLQVKDIQLQSKAADLNKLQLDFKKLNANLQTEVQQKNVNNDKVKQLEDQKSQLQQQLDEAQKQLQARAAEKARLASLSTTQKVYAAEMPSGGAVAGCGDNEYAHFIYMHESGCNLGSVNSRGCVGIGQSCPGGSGLANDCPDWRVNYACQNAHFTRYAAKYGGWQGSYNFWVAHKWW